MTCLHALGGACSHRRRSGPRSIGAGGEAALSLIALVKPKGPTGFGYGSTAEEVTAGRSLEGKTILVTGVNAGLGRETLRVLALRGAHVIGTARTEDKARAACASAAGGKTTPLACELSDPTSVRRCAAAVRAMDVRLDAMILNAGIMALPERQVAYGCELQFFTNHVGHFLLTTSLLDRLAEGGRVVAVSSRAHRRAPREGIRFGDLAMEREYEPWLAYGQSKLANILFAKQLAARLAGTGKTANAIHPGVIKTQLARHLGAAANLYFAIAQPIFLKSVGQGAATQCYVATHPAAASITGQYWEDCNVARPRRDADDAALAARLWEKTEEIVARLP